MENAYRIAEKRLDEQYETLASLHCQMAFLKETLTGQSGVPAGLSEQAILGLAMFTGEFETKLGNALKAIDSVRDFLEGESNKTADAVPAVASQGAV